MRKFLSVLLLCTFLLALTTSLTGCKGVTTESKLKSMVEKAPNENIKVISNEQLGNIYIVKPEIDKRAVMDYFPEPIVKGFGESLKEKQQYKRYG